MMIGEAMNQWNNSCCPYDGYCCYGEGPTGPQGNTGATGPMGPAGPQGLQGATGATGVTGATGIQGPQGPIGESGITGATGSADAIQIRNTETSEPGTSAQVIDTSGAPLHVLDFIIPRGYAGDIGPTGPQGIQGIPGPQGPQGITGPTGNTGMTGATGPQGIQGEQGPQGITGTTGVTGSRGPTGPTGVIPYPAYGSFNSRTNQSLAYTGTYVPVQLSRDGYYQISLESDGTTITVLERGVYVISYTIIASSGASATANVGITNPKGGSLPTLYLSSNRPLNYNNTMISASFVGPLAANDQLQLGVYSPQTVELTYNNRLSSNASITIFRIGS